MPTSNSTTKIHPVYAMSESRSALFLAEPSTIKAIDNSLVITPEMNNEFYCRRSDTVKVNYPGGQSKRHYYQDRTLAKVVEGGEVVYYVNKDAAMLEGYKFSARLRQYAKETERGFYGTETLLDYHSSTAREFKTLPEDKFKIGVEVEKEHSDLQTDVLAWKLFQETGWAKERDGSLGFGGFELVSPVMPLDDIDRVKEICQPVKKYLNANCSNACGGHFNISCEGIDNEELLERMRPFSGVLYSLYERRLNNRYCRVKAFTSYGSEDKYSAFFLKSGNIVEIRLFPAIKTMNNLLWRVRLMQILLRRKNWNFAHYMEAMIDTKSRLHAHLRKIFTYEQVIAKAKKAYVLQKTYTGMNAAEMAKCATLLASVESVPLTADNDFTVGG